MQIKQCRQEDSLLRPEMKWISVFLSVEIRKVVLI